MDPVVDRFAQLMGVNDYLFGKVVEGLSDEELWQVPTPDANPMLWLAGHLALYRGQLAKTIGTGRALGWGKLFAQHTQPERGQEYPTIAEISAAFVEIGTMIRTRLGEMTDDELAAPASAKFPIADNSIRGAVTFLTYHEGYHVGQMAYLRKCLGYVGVVDGH